MLLLIMQSEVDTVRCYYANRLFTYSDLEATLKGVSRVAGDSYLLHVTVMSLLTEAFHHVVCML